MTPMRRGVLIAGLVLGIPLALVLIAILVLDWDDFRAPLAARASDALGREVRLTAPLDVALGWPVSTLVLRDIEVANVPGAQAPDFLHIDRLRVDIHLRRLLGGDLVIPLLKIEEPELALEKNADGEVNWRFDTGEDEGSTREELPEIERLLIDDGRIGYVDLTQDIDLEMQLARVKGSADDDADRIALEGRGSIRGADLAFHFAGGSLDELRRGDMPYPLRGRLEAGATRARFDGELREPLRGRGLDLRLSVAGDSAASLYALTGIALLPTPPYEVDGRLRYNYEIRDEEIWRFEDFTGRMGGSDLHGWLRWDPRGARPMLRARFTSERLALADLGPLIGVPHEEKEEETDGDGRVLPDVPLDPARIAAMDADVQFDGARVVATGMPFKDFSLHLTLADRVLRIEPLRFTSGAGALELFATVDGTRAPPHADIRLDVRALPLGPLFEEAAEALDARNVASGTLEGEAKLSGSGGSVRKMLGEADGHIRLQSHGGNLSQLMIELMGLDVAESVGFLLAGDEPVPIRCMLADFEARAGILRPRPFVLDTEDTLVTGEGSINLGTERLDLTLNPAPKDVSPVALRTPLTIEGSFADPAFGVEKGGLIARGVVAAALGILFPPAAVAALFEPGTGEDANCAVLLAPPPATGAMSAQEETTGGGDETP